MFMYCHTCSRHIGEQDDIYELSVNGSSTVAVSAGSDAPSDGGTVCPSRHLSVHFKFSFAFKIRRTESSILSSVISPLRTAS